MDHYHAQFLLPQPQANPECPVQDAKACKLWLSSISLINVAPAQLQLLSLLRQQNDTALVPRERLKILEMLREPVSMVQEELAKKYLNRPLPFHEEHLQQWELVCELWRAMQAGYRLVLQAALQGDQDALEYGPFAGQRALYNLGRWFSEFHATYRQVPPSGWHTLHEIYREIEAQGWANKRLKDTLQEGLPYTTPMAAYCHVLMVELSNPSQMTVRQFRFVDGLLSRWSLKLNVTPAAPEARLPPLQVDLAGGSPARSLPLHDAGQPRYIDRDPVVASLAKRIKMLRDGSDWDVADLGDDLVAAGGVQLLSQLYRLWSEKGDRVFPRRQATEEVEIGGDWPRIYAQLSGRLFEVPKESKEIRASGMADFQLFGRRANETFREGGDNTLHLPPLEGWSLQDESASGLRLQAERTGQQWLQHQLVMIRRGRVPDTLGIVRRLQLTGINEVELGVQLLAGQPTAAIVSATGVQSLTIQPQPAVFLPDVPSLLQLATVMVPVGVFQVERVLEAQLPDGVRRFKLLALQERGSNYESYRFSWA